MVISYVECPKRSLTVSMSAPFSKSMVISAANTGNLSNVKKAMKEHHKYEYALLFKQYNSNKK